MMLHNMIRCAPLTGKSARLEWAGYVITAPFAVRRARRKTVAKILHPRHK